MTAKARIVEALGEHDLLRPVALNEALVANNQARYYLSLLGAARAAADREPGPPSDLAAERLAAGIGDPWLDQVVERSRRTAGGGYLVPRARDLHDRLVASLQATLTALRAAGAPEAAALGARIEALLAPAPDLRAGMEPAGYADLGAGGPPDGGDSLRRVVLDTAGELARSRAGLAGEMVAGADTYGLQAEDRRQVRAFMQGVTATARLKFDHPGLETTATLAGGHLVIENDIGTTKAHVLVVHVDGPQVTVRYADEHPERLRFFQSMLQPFGLVWSVTTTRDGAAIGGAPAYYVCEGTYTARQAGAEVDTFLEHLGSRVVFLIDWNRARKRLRSLVGSDQAVALLTWAEQHDYGHRAFLEMGADRLFREAVELAADTSACPGQALERVLHPDEMLDALRFALRRTAEGLLTGRSPVAVRNEVVAQLLSSVRKAQRSPLNVVAQHAALVVGAALAARDATAHVTAGDGGFAARASQRNARRERRANELVREARVVPGRAGAPRGYEQIMAISDVAIDRLQETSFLLTLLPDKPAPPAPLHAVQPLTSLVVRVAQEYQMAVEAASHMGTGTPDDSWHFLEAVDRVITLEHVAGSALGSAKSAIVTTATGFTEIEVLMELVQKLGLAAGALVHASQILRQQVLAGSSGTARGKAQPAGAAEDLPEPAPAAAAVQPRGAITWD